jgi:L-fuconolactonase
VSALHLKDSMPEKIDAHHHLWRYTPQDYGWIDDSMSAIRNDFLPANLRSELAAAGIAGSVAVQARQTLEETRWLLDLAEANDFIRGVVGWAPIAGENFPECMEEFDLRPKLKGLRHVIQAEKDENYILRADFNSGITAMQGSGLVYDILIFERHLAQTVDFVDEHPKQIFVLDHIAKPRIAAGVFEPWATHIRELARREHVFCKLSGMVTEADWQTRPAGFATSALEPYLDVVVEAFGPDRLMAGSDWPVCLLATGYSAWFATLDHYFRNFSAPERESIFGETATYVYDL